MIAFHEAPKCIFELVQHHTGGDYALAHKCAEDPQYLATFKKAKEDGRIVILDNSLYELRTQFDPETYLQIITELEPTMYIVPDAWHDAARTQQLCTRWFQNDLSSVPKDTLSMGVAQGDTIEEIIETYEFLHDKVDVIAFNFDQRQLLTDVESRGLTVPEAMSEGRVKLLNTLMFKQVIDATKSHHLLGCGVPQELLRYPAQWKDSWLTSIDTCNPVLHGMLGMSYGVLGLTTKAPGLMANMWEFAVGPEQIDYITYNMMKFNDWMVK